MNKVWYNKPSKKWKEALPVGNGHMGVMIFGDFNKETLCFNDGTFWSGYPKDYNNEESAENLNKIRSLIFEGKNQEAELLAEEKTCGFYSETFLPLGRVYIDFNNCESKNFSRALELDKGIHIAQNDKMKSILFSSYPKNISCYRVMSKEPFSAIINTDSQLRHEVFTDDGLNLVGYAPDYDAPNYTEDPSPVKYTDNKGMAFALRTVAETDGNISYEKDKIIVKDAKVIDLYFAVATGFKSFDQMPETNQNAVLNLCKEKLNLEFDFDDFLSEHICDFSKVYKKSTVSFNEESDKTTDKLLRKAKHGNVTPALCELFYNYGKYLAVSGSREGSQPLNLQGQWNDETCPPWSSNYTVNINTQMNYWGLSRANLNECIEPLINMVWEIVQNGKKTAKINYGCDGFACNHNVDLWRKTSPVLGNCSYMLAPLCGVWLVNEVYSHYKNGVLLQYREKVIEIMTEAVKFLCDYLVLHEGKYVICPSTSPENLFVNKGKKCALDYASAFDMGLVKQCFKNYLELNINNELTKKIKDISSDLYDFQYGKRGICEFHKDYKIPERGHRHFSPLYGFHPGNLIKYHKNKYETEQIKKLFEDRIKHSKEYIGWSAAWAICLASRLHDSKNVKKVIQKFLGFAVYKNMFCYHPVDYFQIDGNFGFIAAINEMLIYEEDGIIELIPALPKKYKDGKAENLLVNGVQISFEWKNCKIVSIKADKHIKIYNLNLSENASIGNNIKLVNLE